MKIITLMENTACRDDIASGHGLSLYIETPKHKILFDMGPDSRYLENAEKLGVNSKSVDTAILSHGHYDHGGGLKAFCEINEQAKIYLRRKAFGSYFKVIENEAPEYIGIDQTLNRERFLYTEDLQVIDEELMLFSAVADSCGALASSAFLKEKTTEGFQQDLFFHEQNLLITAEGKTVLIAGCAHRGITNILRTAVEQLGRRPDAAFGGFHLFQLTAGDSAADGLIDMTGTALLPGETIYYTGHCTGDYAYQRLKTILGNRLQPMSGGSVTEI